MAQIIKHRRGSITDVKGLTNRNGEIVIASGSIGDLSGPFALYGSPVLVDEGVAGAFKATSKLYQGGTAPTISNATYGSILDGTPFHSTGTNALYILNNDGVGNQKLNLTGNIEGFTISGLSVTSITGTTAYFTSITGSLEGTASYIDYSNINNPPTIGDGTITIEGASGLTGSDTFTVNQTSNKTITLVHADTSSTGSTNNVGNNVVQNVLIDEFGHVTGYTSTEISGGTADSASYVNWNDVDGVPNFVYASGDTMTGNLLLTSAGVSASFFSGAFNGNLTGTASYATQALTASFALNATSASYALNSTSASYAVSSSYINVLQNTTNTSYPFIFTTGVTAGNKVLYTDSATTCYINPSTNVIGATTFIGNLTGTASYASQALSSSYVNVLQNTTNTSYPLIFTTGVTAGNKVLYTDSGTECYINPSTNTIGATTFIGAFSGNLTGTASYATQALSASFALNATSASYALNASSASYINYNNISGMPNFVDVSGDTMTGNLLLTSAGVSASFFSGSFYGDGNNLTGVASDLSVTGDTGSATITLTSETLGINGTTNEIETSVSTGGTVTIGLPNQVTIQTGSIANNLVVGNDLLVSGNFYVMGDASEVHITSSIVEIDDNILRLNAYIPFERYGGIEVMDSGSIGLSGSILWDSVSDYWLSVDTINQSSIIVGITKGTLGSETTLTTNTIPKATSNSTIGNSLLTDNATTLTYNTNKFTVTASDGATLIAGNVTLSSSGGSDAGSNTSAIIFRNSSNVLGYISTTETTDVLDGILGYKSSDGALVFSTVIDGGTF